ncbi:TPR domain protein [Syntrophotalea carbinolica DSM 2380]|uniref:TPR domain protein n=1 Tax=Syntrophotalea carbinolica (strain DSM 2380 / NBRC 103641 / GraBd1) TaxID=338963 RepID=Q3A1E4_SYNC1|nr:lipopolysaccharide assembly protein LapA domain-containing protein [Syntrophotalea carbinolica]ABA89813.1 TPR domain protein [Syntrophotalea carbinolica DSM 2380]
MILMAFVFLVLIIFFLLFYILNPQTVAVFYWFGNEFTSSLAVVVAASVLSGLLIGYLLYIYGATGHLVRDWRRKRTEKRHRSVMDLYRQAMGRLVSGDLKKSRRLLLKAHGQDGTQLEVLQAMARVCRAEGQPSEALEYLLKARKQSAENLQVLFLLADTYLAADQVEDAVATYRSILAVEPDNLEALRRLRDLHMRSELWNEASDLQKRLLKKLGGTPDNQEQRIRCGLRLETARMVLESGRADTAAADLKALVKDQPDFVAARVLLGDAWEVAGQPQEAAGVWQEGYRRFGEAVFLARLEDLAMATENPTELLDFYRTTALNRPEDLLLRLYYGKFCLRLEMVEEALEQLSEIEKSGADFPQLHLLLAEAHVRRSRMDESVKEFRKVLDFDGRTNFGYACDACNAASAEWFGRCEECGAWGSCRLSGYERIKNPPVSDLREIHHGEQSA